MADKKKDSLYGTPDDNDLEHGRLSGLTYDKMSNMGFDMGNIDKSSYDRSVAEYQGESNERDSSDY